jgi:hypothetical protein
LFVIITQLNNSALDNNTRRLYYITYTQQLILDISNDVSRIFFNIYILNEKSGLNKVTNRRTVNEMHPKLL